MPHFNIQMKSKQLLEIALEVYIENGTLSDKKHLEALLYHMKKGTRIQLNIGYEDIPNLHEFSNLLYKPLNK